MIIEPFMLRRVKDNVQNELSEKVVILYLHKFPAVAYAIID
jgi:SNF2 family DNA or RNA helicase